MLHSATKALLIPLALAIAAPAWSQQSDSQEQQQQHEKARRKNQQRQAQSRQRQRDEQQQQRRRAEQRRRHQQSDRQEARTHYGAGLVAGYMLGYADGLDDYVLIVGTTGGQRTQTTAHQGRDQFRRQMRERARREMTDRMRGPRQRQRGEMIARSQQQQRFTGQIISLKRVRLQNDQQRHLVALVKNNQGKRRIVDLGPTQRLQDFNLQQGDQISFQGRILRTRDGVPVVNARRVQSQGQSIAIRADGQQGQGRTRR